VLVDVLDVLRCPVCAGTLGHDGAALRCAARHTFDVARQGYVNLLGGAGRGTADTAAMVQARSDFLAAGHYHPLAAAVASAVADVDTGDPSPVLLDAGAGTGYYLGAALDARPTARGLALDLSKFAARRAARAHPRIAVAVWDTWRPLPIRDAVVSVVLDVFAPRNAAEFARVIRPGGVVLVVTPTDRHLAELSDVGGMLSVDARKDERLERTVGRHLTLAGREELRWPLSLTGADVARLVRMGPSAWHLDEQVHTGRVATADALVSVTASVLIHRYRWAG
jgi:23S rRNA (guanine745-N1)-methyltransferase